MSWCHSVIVPTGAVVIQDWGEMSLSISEKKLPKKKIYKAEAQCVQLFQIKNGAPLTSYNDNTPVCHLPFAIGHLQVGQPF